MSAYALPLPMLHFQTASSRLLEQSNLTTPKQSTLQLNNNNVISSNNRSNSITQTIREVQHFPLMHARVCLPFASYNKSNHDLFSVQNVKSSVSRNNNDQSENNNLIDGASKYEHISSLVYAGQTALWLLRCHNCTIFADRDHVCSAHKKYFLYMLFPHQPTLTYISNPDETVLLIM